MLTGHVPCQGDRPGAVLLSPTSRAMPAARELPVEIAGHVEQGLRRGMAEAPQDRYPTVGAFVAALTPAAWPSILADERINVIAAQPRGDGATHRVPVVLVVDDGAANRELIEACLAGIDCEVRTAEDGRTALKLIEEHAPDLVLLDVQIPATDPSQ